ncbi:4-hydroxy-3-methylbut-2-en-1-yl diphosphate synthase [Verrucomicrobiota bacterium]|nr:4-hydroxy-3-methylbut-2-en-1-yl diphosphate synthase [Verrucomicrobiota bacterium]
MGRLSSLTGAVKGVENDPMPSDYCPSRHRTVRRLTRVVNVGDVAVGGANPIRLQSMTTSDTEDVAATVAQAIRLAEAGCEIIRITAPNKAAASALKDIHRQFRAAGFNQPLVADIHFLPFAAMEAVEHVEKVRVNPGNYADKKKFAVLEYTDAAYAEELERLHEAFTPLVLRAKALGRSLRIGTNHGSLSDRIMNRFGDSPNGMVESALEFIRIAESHGFKDMILSMKSSNPKVMVEAYRLAAARMSELGMDYPLHLGVTEAGEGEDARIKSALGIGSLLADGLGDTIRVSLTEDPWHEIPVCREIVSRAEGFAALGAASAVTLPADPVDPFSFARRETELIELSSKCLAGSGEVPRVIVRSVAGLADWQGAAKEILDAHAAQREVRAEGLLVRLDDPAHAAGLCSLRKALGQAVPALFVETSLSPADFPFDGSGSRLVVVKAFSAGDAASVKAWGEAVTKHDAILAADLDGPMLAALAKDLAAIPAGRLILTSSQPQEGLHATGTIREIVRCAAVAQLEAPLWIRATVANAVRLDPGFQSRLIEASIFAGGLLVDGLRGFPFLRDADLDGQVAHARLRHPARRAHAPDQDRVCRLSELRPHPLRHPVDDPEDQGTHRPPQVRHHRRHGLAS